MDKATIKKQLEPFLDTLTPEELIVFKAMIKKMRTSLVQEDESTEAIVDKS